MRIFLFNRRARAAVRGLALLRRAYEHVLVMAVLEGTRNPIAYPQTQPAAARATFCREANELDRKSAGPWRGNYYQGYVDALQILGGKAELIARQL